MKKLLLASASLLIFAISILIVQSSCSKTTAQAQNSTTQENKILFSKGVGATAQLWIANYDGTNATQVNVAFPANVSFSPYVAFTAKLSPDGQKIFFLGTDASLAPNNIQIYSCDRNGSNVSMLVNTGTNALTLCDVF